TGSGESTNKVASVVEDARERREETLSDHADGAFAPGPAREADDETTDTGAETADDDGAGESDDTDAEADGQSGLTDFM
ncbi:MAG: hypothetical protein A07HB70_01706, partial [uncultured archaeon A07HB70]